MEEGAPVAKPDDHGLLRRDLLKGAGALGTMAGLKVGIGALFGSLATETVHIATDLETQKMVQAAVAQISANLAELLAPPQEILARVDPEVASTVRLPLELAEVLADPKEFRFPNLPGVFKTIQEQYARLAESGAYSLSLGVGARSQTAEIRGPTRDENTRDRGLYFSLYGDGIVDQETLNLFPHCLFNFNNSPSAMDTKGGKISKGAIALSIADPEGGQEGNMVFGNYAFGVYQAHEIVMTPNFILAKVRPYAAEGVYSDPEYLLIKKDGSVRYLNYPRWSPNMTDYILPAHFAGEDLLGLLSKHSDKHGMEWVDLYPIYGNPTNEGNQQLLGDLVSLFGLTHVEIDDKLQEKFFGENQPKRKLTPVSFAVLGIDGEVNAPKSPETMHRGYTEAVQIVNFEKTYALELHPVIAGERGNPSERKIAIVSETAKPDATGLVKWEQEVVVLESPPGESLHIIGKIGDKVICARISQQTHDLKQDVADFRGLAIVGKNGVEKEISFPTPLKVPVKMLRDLRDFDQYMVSPMLIPVVDNKRRQLGIWTLVPDKEGGEPDKYTGQPLETIPLNELLPGQVPPPAWQNRVVNIKINEVPEETGGEEAGEDKEQTSSSPIENSLGTEPPIFKDLDENTILIHIPGAGGDQAQGDVEYFSPWFEAFLQAKGLSEAEARRLVDEYRRNIGEFGRSASVKTRLQYQFAEMRKKGIFVIPWEMVTGKEKSAFQMALVLSGFIKNLPEGTKVIVMGHSLGGAVVRSFLKIYQEGTLDQNLKGRQVIGSISISEGYQGDFLDTLVYYVLKKCNLEQIGDKEAEQIYDRLKQVLESDLSWLTKILPVDLAEIGKKRAEAVRLLAANKPLVTDYIKKIATTVVDPAFITGVNAGKLRQKGCLPIVVRSPADMLAANAEFEGAIEFSVRTKPNGVEKVVLRKGSSQAPISLPTADDIKSVGGAAHSNHAVVAPLVFAKAN